MAQFNLTFSMDNAAFEFEALEETSRILKAVKTQIDLQGLTLEPQIIRDINGNKIGTFSIE